MIIFSKDEANFVEMVLRTADDNDTDIRKSEELVKQEMGAKVMFVGEYPREDPPSPSEVRKCLSGQRFEGDDPMVKALQILITVYVFDLTRSDELSSEEIEDLLDLLDGIHEKISEAVDEG